MSGVSLKGDDSTVLGRAGWGLSARRACLGRRRRASVVPEDKSTHSVGLTATDLSKAGGLRFLESIYHCISYQASKLMPWTLPKKSPRLRKDHDALLILGHKPALRIAMVVVMGDRVRQPLQCFPMLCDDLCSQRNATIPSFSKLFLL